METNPVIQRLFELGHFHNPAYSTGVTEADLPKLRLTDASVKIALASYQEFFAVELDRFSFEHHGRISIADGKLGPATAELLAMERCGYPDYDMSVVAKANGRGSWPSGCHTQYPSNHSFAVWFERGGMPQHWRDIFDEAWLLVRQAYADIGIAFFEPESKAAANTVVSWQRSRTWIGLAIVPNSPRCGEKIWAKFDTSYGSAFERMKRVWQIARLMAHEFCHNMGLSHTRGGIMNPSIVGGEFRPNAWRGDPSEPPLARFFGGVPVTLVDLVPPTDPKPPTDPPSDSSGLWFSGGFTAMNGEVSIGDFILVPKPKV